jgi:hypothetical protein
VRLSGRRLKATKVGLEPTSYEVCCSRSSRIDSSWDKVQDKVHTTTELGFDGQNLMLSGRCWLSGGGHNESFGKQKRSDEAILQDMASN